MIKAIGLGKRKPGSSRREFVDYYKNSHSKLGETVMKRVGAVLYRRNYLVPSFDGLHEDIGEADFDVMTEFWFPNRESFIECFEICGGEMLEEFIADELKFCDRSATRMFIIEEEDESELA